MKAPLCLRHFFPPCALLRRRVRPLAFGALWLLLVFTPAGCVTEEVVSDTRRGNFESCWKTLDEHYCFFGEKQKSFGLDWNEVHARYTPMINERMTSRQLFEVLGKMVNELRDGHINLSAAHNVNRYGAWYDNFPMNFSDSLLHKYLGRTDEYYLSSALAFRVLDDNVGYVRCSTFDYTFGSGNLSEMLQTLGPCSGLIIDVRSNGGGMLTSAEQLASLFINEPMVRAFIQHKTGKGHHDFSAMRPITIRPFAGLRWQKKICILTNRRTFSAANSFVAFLKGLPNVTVVGDQTGGGGGLPFNAELPNGWLLRFSACPMYDAQGLPIEEGIRPDVKVDISSADYARSYDTIIERARALLREQ